MGIHATRDEFFEAVEALPERARLGLIASAGYLASGHSGYASGGDLFGETVLRVAEGTRRWPLAVDLSTFLRNAMRSVVSDTRGRVDMSAKRRVGLDDALASRCPRTREALGFADSAEAEALAAEERRWALAAEGWARLALAEDELALMVLEGMLADMTKAEVVKARGMTDRQYRASMGRLHTALARLGREIRS